jgi:ketosteroid isomerase-like protein
MTHVFRHEADGWKLILGHADPLTEFRGPGVVPPRNG